MDNIIGTRNIKKNCITGNNTNNKSFNKNQNYKYNNTGLILKNANISNFSSNKPEQKMKVNTNSNITNNKTKISSYNNIIWFIISLCFYLYISTFCFFNFSNFVNYCCFNTF